MKVREVIALVEADGWYLVRTRGDHRQYKHPTKRGLVTIHGHRRNIREAIAFHLEGLKLEGLPIPEPTTLCAYVEAPER